MNESKIIENLMVELKDCDVSGNAERLKEVSLQVSDYISKNHSRQDFDEETKIMLNRLQHVYQIIGKK